MSKLPLELEAQCIRHALGHVLSDWNSEADPLDIIEKIESFAFEPVTDEDITVWEPFESHSGYELSEEIQSLIQSHRSVAFNAIAITKRGY